MDANHNLRTIIVPECTWTRWQRQEQFVLMEPFVTNLRARAKALGLAHAEVARRAGLTERRYGNYVVGAREPDLATLIKIASALHTSPDELLGVAQAPERNEHEAMLDRLTASAATMSTEDLELLAAQAEAIIQLRSRQAR